LAGVSQGLQQTSLRLAAETSGTRHGLRLNVAGVGVAIGEGARA
jgi:hypothetical protein